MGTTTGGGALAGATGRSAAPAGPVRPSATTPVAARRRYFIRRAPAVEYVCAEDDVDRPLPPLQNGNTQWKSSPESLTRFQGLASGVFGEPTDNALGWNELSWKMRVDRA